MPQKPADPAADAAADAAAGQVHLLLAGAPAQWQLAGQPPRELGARDAALLAWLAVEGPTPRAQLAALLWPESDSEAARNALRQRLFQLRKQVGRDVAVGTAALALAAGVSHDLADARTLLGQAQPEGSEAFTQWLAQQRQQRAGRTLGQWAAEADAAEAAREAAQARIAEAAAISAWRQALGLLPQ